MDETNTRIELRKSGYAFLDAEKALSYARQRHLSPLS
jgi:anionic cell wall polymer biosynthesis LytR-Cps2A-Psr (LCP) family protein